MNATPLSPELELLCTCARRHPGPAAMTRIRALAAPTLGWEYVIASAVWHGVSALVLDNLVNAGAAAPAAVLTRLSEEQVQTTALNLSLAVQLRGVIDHMRARGIPAITFKGPALAAVAFGHLGARAFQDLDVLVPLAWLAEARAVMRDLGYRMSFREHRIFRVYPAAGKDEFFTHAAPGVANIEVHVAIAEWALSIPFDTNALIQRAVSIDTPAGPLWTLCPEDTVLVVAVQAMTHHWAHLKHIADIDALLAQPLDWAEVLSRARSAHVSRILAVTLLLVRDLLGGEIPDAARDLIDRDAEAAALARELTTHFFAPLDRRSVILSKSRLRMRCREQAADRLRYAIRAPLYRLACGVIGKVSADPEAATPAPERSGPRPR